MYKSLEHIIREIKEGKCCCEKKKDSLEGAIRKVQRKEYESSYGARDSKPVEEDIGGLAGSGTGGEPKLHTESGKKKKAADEEDTKMPRDYGKSIEEMNVVTNTGAEMMGRQFYTQSPLIGPPDASQNSKGRQAAKRISMLRNKEIGKFSNKNVSDSGKISEDVFSEGKIPKFPKISPKATETLTKDAEDVFSKIFDTPPKGGEVVPYKEPKVPVKPAEPEVKAPPKPGELVPFGKPKLPAEPEVKAPPKPAEPEVKAPPKPAEPKTDVVVEPKVEPKVKPAEPKVKPAEPKVPVKPAEPKVAVPKVPGIKLPFPFMPAAVAKPVELTGPHAPVYTSVSKHRKHSPVVKEDTQTRKSIQDMPRKDSGDRHNIEFVGRKDADPKTAAEKTSRQAQYKIKVIDEAKKLADIVKKVSKENEGKTKVYDNVIINPDLNRIDPNQQIKEGLLGKAIKYGLGQTAATAGLSGLYGAGVASGRGEDPIKGGIEGAKAVVTEPIRKYKEGDKLGAAADVASTVHPVGALTDLARYAAQTDTGRKIGKAIGDYVPGAKAAAEAAKRFREKIGGKSTFEPAEPKQPEPPKEPEQTSSEIVPRKVKTTVEPESGGKKIKSFKNYNKNK